MENNQICNDINMFEDNFFNISDFVNLVNR
jgi:hypothetical protein